MQKIWICGAKGQIGRAINEVIDKLEYKILDTDIDDLDITDTDEVLRFGEMNRPDVIINCSGLTDLQECEKDLAKAFKTNALGARNLSIVARKVEAKLVHFQQMMFLMGKAKNLIPNLMKRILKQLMEKVSWQENVMLKNLRINILLYVVHGFMV